MSKRLPHRSDKGEGTPASRPHVAGVAREEPMRVSKLLNQWMLRYLALVAETGADSACFQAVHS